MSRWLVLYASGETFSSEQGEPWEAPRAGVQAVFQEDDATGVAIESSPSGYWFWAGQWRGCDTAGFWDHLFHYPQPLVLFGRCLKDEEWEGRMQRLAQEYLGRLKSAWRVRERAP